jgi:tetratricopeptide (TPR) repeat protein
MGGDFTTSAAYWERAIDGYRRLGTGTGKISALRGLATAAAGMGDYERARPLLEQALHTAEQARDRRLTYHVLHSLAELELQLGNLDAADPLFSRSAELAREEGDRVLQIHIRLGIGDAALARGDFKRAAASYQESLSTALKLGFRRAPAACVAGLAAVAAGHGDTEQAGLLWGAVEKLEHELGFPVHPFEKQRYEKLIRPLADKASVDFRNAVEQGRDMSLDEITAFALGDS